jgi:hypothetical protein
MTTPHHMIRVSYMQHAYYVTKDDYFEQNLVTLWEKKEKGNLITYYPMLYNIDRKYLLVLDQHLTKEK